MATSLTKMFVNYKGTKAEFENVKANYSNQIVFINNGACIYARGNYYGTVEEALAGLKYFSSIKVGEKVATSAGPNGTLTFAATDPSSVAVDVDAKGITIGLTEAFVNKVNAAAVKSEVEGELALVNAAIEALEGVDEGYATRIKAVEDALGLGIEGEGDETVAAQIAALSTRISTEETNRTEADKTLQANIDTKVAKTDYEAMVEALNAAINAKVAQSDYDAKIAELVKADTDNLKAAKDYADSLVYDETQLKNRVAANEQAIATLNGEGDGSVKKAVAEGIASVVASAPEDFDTLKEVADWIANDTTGAASMQNAIAANAAAIEVLNGTEEGSVAKAVADAVAVEKGRAELAESGLDTRIVTLEDAKTNLDGRVATIEGDYLKLADKTELQGNIDLKVSTATYEAKVAELVKADSDNLQAAKDYADGLAGNYDAKGSAAAAESAANAYTDGKVDGKFDAVGSAAKALEDANAYTDEEVKKLTEGVITEHTNDIDAIEAFLNDPWLEL